KNVDMYFLPQEELKERCLREKKIPPSKVEVSGIPISPDFSVEKNKDLLRKKWKVKENLYTVLVMGGGQGWGAIQETVLSLNKIDFPLQVIVVSGTNRKLRKNLCRLSSSLNFPFQVYGYVREIDELMEISDLLITKPGGLTTAEALSKGLPMIVIDSITGQERRNKKMLLEKGFALAIDNTEKLREAVGFFFNNGFDKNVWKKKTRQIARPNSSCEIVRKIMSMREKMER
ncbi:glycosyltransferase, partial [Candidatus Aerophobetes bacterium]|nr:glycosyltransferase [Candidatus Aerophobetes bacterium]